MKGFSESLNIVWAAVLGLIVLSVLVAIFGGSAIKFNEGTSESTDEAGFRTVCLIKCSACCISNTEAECNAETSPSYVSYEYKGIPEPCDCDC